MEPLNPYEIQELVAHLDRGVYPIPIGSVWVSVHTNQMFVVLHHANLPVTDGNIPALVLQSIPDGMAWTQPTEQFLSGDWEFIGVVWDRNVHV